MTTPTDPFKTLVEVMDTLLGPNGCPWDREQTHASLKASLLEETYECLEAIDGGDMGHLREELGDLLLQVVFHGKLAERDGTFTLNAVIDELAQKLVRRHPHVFKEPGESSAKTAVKTAEEVLSTWETIKRGEASKKNRDSLLDGVPKHLPALMRSAKLSKRAAREAGFDWGHPSEVWDKITEEIAELKQAETLAPDTRERAAALSSEVGDLLFAVSSLARHLGADPEEALQAANARFISRFQWMEKNGGGALGSLSKEEKESLWQEAKKALATSSS